MAALKRLRALSRKVIERTVEVARKPIVRVVAFVGLSGVFASSAFATPTFTMPAAFEADTLVPQMLTENQSTIVYGLLAVAGLGFLRSVFRGTRGQATRMAGAR